MSGYSVFRIIDSVYDDFEDEVRPERVVLYTKYFVQNNLEIGSECYDELGSQIISRSESRFNEKNLEVESLEFMGNDETPFKITSREYNERGQLTLTSVYYDGNEPLADLNQYDQLGRLILSTHLSDDGEEEKEIYSYVGDCPRPAKLSFWWNGDCQHETSYSYEFERGQYELVEELFIDHNDKYKSRIRKLFDPGDNETGAVEKVYNTEGDFLEECREIQDGKGNPLRRTWHLDEIRDSSAFKMCTYSYDAEGRVLNEHHIEKNVNTYINRIRYDAQGRKVKEHIFLGQGDEIYIYKYDED